MTPAEASSPTRLVRSVGRRAALGGLGLAYTLMGSTRAAMAEPGVTLLLVHNTPPGELSLLLRFVDQHRDVVRGFSEAMGALSSGVVQRPMVALTFDDGFASNLVAARALAERGLDACFYVPTSVVGLPKHESDAFFGRDQDEGVMTWTGLEELRSAAHVVGSHCRRHLALTGMPAAEAEDQIKGSVEVLRERLGETRHFAWPFGSLAHAPVENVLRWCAEIDVVAASGVRGRNTVARYHRRGYLSRDAVDLRWLELDYRVFVTRAHRRLAHAGNPHDVSARAGK